MATADKKPKAVRYTSPKGTFVYPYLVKPDFGRGTFANTKGVYKVNLRLTEEDAAPLLEVLQPLFDAAIKEGEQKFSELKIDARKKLKSLTETPLFDVEYDPDTEQPTGYIVFKFSTSASGTNAKGEPWTRTISLFDATGKSIKPSIVGGGTIGKVSFEASEYFVPATGVAGLKLYLVAAQILELNTSSNGGSASSYGFGAEEGYEGIEDEGEASESEGSSDSSGDDDNF